ncbi:MAG: ABC transporter ATP-binding protein [Planctomycetota bacterium]
MPPGGKAPAFDPEAHRRPLDWDIARRLWSYTRRYKWLRNTLIVIVIVRSLQLTLVPWMAAHILGMLALLGTQGGPTSDELWANHIRWTVALIGLMIVTQVTFMFRQRLSQYLGEAIIHDLRNDLFAHLQRMSMAFYDRTKLGSIISRMTSDLEYVRFGVQDVVFVSTVQLGQMLAAAAIMLWYDAALFVVVLALAPLLGWLLQHFRVRIGTAWREVQESMSRVTSNIAESVNGIRVTQGFVRQDRNAERFNELIEAHGQKNIEAASLQGTFLPLLELNNQFAIAAMLVLGGYQVIYQGFFASHSDAIQYESLFVFFNLVPLFFGPVSTIGRMYNQALTAMAGAERVFKLIDTDPESLDAPDATPLHPIAGHVAFNNVGFAYVQDRPVLHDVNFDVEPGQTLALVGHTGSGKSTIIKLLAKFYVPTQGQLNIDGRDIRGIGTKSISDQVGIVLQSNFLFTGSVLDNIRVARPKATDAEVAEAARKLDCLDLLESLSDGLHTDVGEAGANLSLGQRQLVCFCRAMLADPRILILDEATSSIDTMTEVRIQTALERLLQGRTSFVVAHRLSTIRRADNILVLDQGRIIERGTHTQLLEQGGHYAHLYRQFIHATQA